MLRRIQKFLRAERKWYIRHVYRDLNHAVDCLTETNLVEKTNLQVFNDSPNKVLEFIQQD